MNVSVLIFWTLFGMVLSSPVARTTCPSDCEPSESYHELPFIHVSELQDSSIAPWTMNTTEKEGREPYSIPQAVCKPCRVNGWEVKPIILQINVFQQIHNNSGSSWCKCPFDLAVGCTCVSK